MAASDFSLPQRRSSFRFTTVFRHSDSNETRVCTFDEMLAQVAAGRGTLEKVKNCPDHPQTSRTETNPRPPPCDGAVTLCGFNLHASVRIAADDDRGIERLFRYRLRPPFSLDRLRLLPDGRFGYSVKKCGRGGCRVRIMTPLGCLARLGALVPPPYYPLTRYHGVLALRARLRQAIVPQPPRDARPSCSAKLSSVAAQESKNHDALATLSACAPQKDVQLMAASDSLDVISAIVACNRSPRREPTHEGDRRSIEAGNFADGSSAHR